MKEKDQKVTKRLRDIGINCFIKYFEVFRANKDERSNEIILNAFSNNNEGWTKKSYHSRASKGKAIFRDSQELDALTYIIDSDHNGKISLEIVEMAMNLRSNILNGFDDN